MERYLIVLKLNEIKTKVDKLSVEDKSHIFNFLNIWMDLVNENKSDECWRKWCWENNTGGCREEVINSEVKTLEEENEKYIEITSNSLWDCFETQLFLNCVHYNILTFKKKINDKYFNCNKIEMFNLWDNRNKWMENKYNSTPKFGFDRNRFINYLTIYLCYCFPELEEKVNDFCKCVYDDEVKYFIEDNEYIKHFIYRKIKEEL